MEVDQTMGSKVLHPPRLETRRNQGGIVLLVEAELLLKVCTTMEKVSIRAHFQVCISNTIISLI